MPDAFVLQEVLAWMPDAVFFAKGLNLDARCRMPRAFVFARGLKFDAGYWIVDAGY